MTNPQEFLLDEKTPDHAQCTHCAVLCNPRVININLCLPGPLWTVDSDTWVTSSTRTSRLQSCGRGPGDGCQLGGTTVLYYSTQSPRHQKIQGEPCYDLGCIAALTEASQGAERFVEKSSTVQYSTEYRRTAKAAEYGVEMECRS